MTQSVTIDPQKHYSLALGYPGYILYEFEMTCPGGDPAFTLRVSKPTMTRLAQLKNDEQLDVLAVGDDPRTAIRCNVESLREEHDRIMCGDDLFFLVRAAEVEVIRPPANVNLEPNESGCGYLIPWVEFLEAVRDGSFIDYDGSGDWATETHYQPATMWESLVRPSEIRSGLTVKPDWATHVMWYNK